MLPTRASLSAILGPTNTGKTHLAVERMVAHSSGMMGFPLRLLAREVYERIVAIKGENQVALITGEERIEPPAARYYCCTVESMPINRDFAFVAVDEAQLGSDPERGHIFTDRMLYARGREETMILGSESLRPIVAKLLPEAEITTRPRFSTLSYAGPKKLSRLPKRSAIVAFSVEQVYSVAEMLRRLRGGAAVVMGALSPQTRNAQVEMYQAGEVDYLVATDAIGMGLNLDVEHVAFAALSKFDGMRRRRLTVAEMAQIAGRAGRHHTDGTFGTLAGEGFEFEPEEVERIEAHEFPSLDWLYWREAEPQFGNLDELIRGLSARPDEEGLRAAPQALDLDVLKRLSDMPAVRETAKVEAKVWRLWDAARLPDFRQMGAEPHSRFVASLWQHLGKGDGFIPHRVITAELARLDNVQGDVDTISGRIAAVRSWTYIAHRFDWLEEPTAMAQRARDIESKLSDALHSGLRQRFVDKRTVKLMRGAASDSGILPVEITVDNRVLVDDEDIGHLDGFAFRVDPDAKAGDRKLLLAAAEKHLVGLLREKARKVTMAEDNEFSLAADGEKRPSVMWQDAPLGILTKGRSVMQPVFQPAKAVAGLEGDSLKQVVERAESWITAELEKHMSGIVALNQLAQDPETEGPVRALASRMADACGIAARYFLSDTLRDLPAESRGAARKGGIVFGALDIFHHQAMKPGAVKWRTALFAAWHDNPMPDLPPDSAVHLDNWEFKHPADIRNAGYRQIGEEYLRIDLAERLIKQAHEARGEQDIFAVDLSYTTSLGVSEDGLKALLRDAGFEDAEAPEGAQAELEAQAVAAAKAKREARIAAEAAAAESGETAKADVEETTEAKEATVAKAEEVAADPSEASRPEDKAEETTASDETDAAEGEGARREPTPPLYTWWRWVGIRKARNNQRKNNNRKADPNRKAYRANNRKGAGNSSPASHGSSAGQGGGAPSELALQLAALTGKDSKKPE